MVRLIENIAMNGQKLDRNMIENRLKRSKKLLIKSSEGASQDINRYFLAVAYLYYKM